MIVKSPGIASITSFSALIPSAPKHSKKAEFGLKAAAKGADSLMILKQNSLASLAVGTELSSFSNWLICGSNPMHRSELTDATRFSSAAKNDDEGDEEEGNITGLCSHRHEYGTLSCRVQNKPRNNVRLHSPYRKHV